MMLEGQTRSDDPPWPGGKRFPRVGSNGDVAIRWADAMFPGGESKSMSFRGATVYSYATPIARRVVNHAGNKGVLITAVGYSMTTKSKHLPPVRRAASRSGLPGFFVDNVLANTEAEHRGNVAGMACDLTALAKKGQRARLHVEWAKAEAIQHLESLLKYAAFVGLGWVDPQTPVPIVLDWLEERQDKAERELGAELRKMLAKAEAAAAVPS